MHIVSTSSQVIKCIPRDKTLSLTLEIRDEQTRETTTKAITGTISGNFLQFDLDFTCVEGNYYTIKLKDGSDLKYYGMVFCTNQSNPDAYKISEGEYVSPSTDNTYVFNE